MPAARVGFNPEQLRKVQEAMNALPGLLVHRVQGFGLRDAAKVVRTKAMSIAPVGQPRRVYRGRGRGSFFTAGGTLRDSHRVGLSSSTPPLLNVRIPGSAAVLIAGEPKAPHWVFMNYGFTTRSGRKINPGDTTATGAQIGYLTKSLMSTRDAQVHAFQIGATKALIRVGNQIRSGRAPGIVARLSVGPTLLQAIR